METLGVEGVGMEVWGWLAGFSIDEDWIELKIPSIGVSASGLVGTVLGRRA